ncbi:MAG: GtrA family protein [Bacteroidales bacterium]
MKKENKKGEFIRFIITGTVATAVLYGIYYPLCRIMNPNLAYTIGFLISFVVNFLMTSFYTFRERPSVKKAIGFGMQQGLNYLFQIGFLNLFLWLHIPKEWAPFPVFVVVLPINFILLRLVFKKSVR